MIADYLTDAIVIIRPTALDAFGEPLDPSTPVTRTNSRAHIDYGLKKVLTTSGAEAVSTAVMIVLESLRPGIDRIEFNGEEHSILAVKQANDWDNVVNRVWCA